MIYFIHFFLKSLAFRSKEQCKSDIFKNLSFFANLNSLNTGIELLLARLMA